jgi:hypothetical protein
LFLCAFLALVAVESLVQLGVVFLWQTQSDCNELLGLTSKKNTKQTNLKRKAGNSF